MGLSPITEVKSLSLEQVINIISAETFYRGSYSLEESCHACAEHLSTKAFRMLSNPLRRPLLILEPRDCVNKRLGCLFVEKETTYILYDSFDSPSRSKSDCRAARSGYFQRRHAKIFFAWKYESAAPHYVFLHVVVR
jgi:hypothetical protein